MKLRTRIATGVLLGSVVVNCAMSWAGQKQAQITQVVGQATPLLKWQPPNQITYGVPLAAAQLNAVATGVKGAALQGTFTYTPAIGSVLDSGIQTLSVTFSPADSRDYKQVSMKVPLVVQKAFPVLAWAAPADIPFGTAISATQLNATATNATGMQVAGTFAYSPAIGSVLSVGSHKLSATFTPSDTQNYSTAAATVEIAVKQAAPILTWNTPQAITYGAVLDGTQLNAVAAGVDGSPLQGAFTYTPSAGTLLNAGNFVLTVTYTPTDSLNYSKVTKSVPLVVNKANPLASWTSPNAITTGTALNGSQLNASASLKGSFSYSPAVGTVLPTGYQTLTAQFVPADTANYNTVTVAVPLRVTDFAIAAEAKRGNIVPWGSGQSVNATVALNSLTQFTGNIGLRCTNVPDTMGCKFTQTTVAVGPNGSATTLEITTAGRSVTYTGFIVFVGGISFMWAARRRLGAFGLYAVLILTLGAAGAGLSGCGGGSRYTQFDGTPKGTYTITVSGESGNLIHSVPVTVVVQ